ncbi:MAG: hypothetical protein WAN48_15120 [Actinomycetes bacterium]
MATKLSDVNLDGSRLSRVGLASLLVAVGYGATLIVAAFLVPTYSSETVSSNGEVRRGSATLIAENGFGAVFVVAIPLLVAIAVGAVLWPRVRRGGLPIAWTLTGLLAVFNLLAMMSIGLFLLPVTLALVVACNGGRAKPNLKVTATPPAIV